MIRHADDDEYPHHMSYGPLNMVGLSLCRRVFYVAAKLEDYPSLTIDNRLINVMNKLFLVIFRRTEPQGYSDYDEFIAARIEQNMQLTQLALIAVLCCNKTKCVQFNASTPIQGITADELYAKVKAVVETLPRVEVDPADESTLKPKSDARSFTRPRNHQNSRSGARPVSNARSFMRPKVDSVPKPRTDAKP